MNSRHCVVIIGGGFGRLRAGRALRSAPVDVTLIDRRNYHLFQPLLYQVATGSLSPGQIAAPIRAVLSRQQNTRVLMGDVVDIEPLARRVTLADGADIEIQTAARVAKLVFDSGLARVDRPAGMVAFIRQHVYKPEYQALV